MPGVRVKRPTGKAPPPVVHVHFGLARWEVAATHDIELPGGASAPGVVLRQPVTGELRAVVGRVVTHPGTGDARVLPPTGTPRTARVLAVLSSPAFVSYEAGPSEAAWQRCLDAFTDAYHDYERSNP